MKQIEEIKKATPDVTVRVARRTVVDQTSIHQGDLYLHRVADDHPRGKETGTRQVAVGTGEGSHHVVEGDVTVYEGKKLPTGVKAPAWGMESDLLGPVVVATDTFTLTHPNHAHHRLPAGTYQVTNQLDYATRRRVQD